MNELEYRWEMLRREANGLPGIFGQVGVRDPENPCLEYDARGYDGRGKCLSDGHYECENCSHLAPNAPRFENDDDTNTPVATSRT